MRSTDRRGTGCTDPERRRRVVKIIIVDNNHVLYRDISQ